MSRALYALAFIIVSFLSCIMTAQAFPGTFFVSGFGTGFAAYREDAVMIARDNAESNMERSCGYYANSFSGEDAYLSEVHISSINAYQAGYSWSASVNMSGKCVVTRY